MEPASLALAEGLVSPSYVRQGAQALAQRRNMIKALLAQRKLPKEGWDDGTIEMLLQELALMDSNNFLGAAGMGEREARCASDIVRRRHLGFGHGIGRSGSITDEQPKAAGSTLAARLTTLLVKDGLQLAGLQDVGAVTVLPVATGMAIMLTLLALKKSRPPQARLVLWPRIDQKSCIKAVQSAGLELVVIPNILEGDELRTDMSRLAQEVKQHGAENILCVLSTTSCFAPRGADSLEDIAKLCQRAGIGHIVNNAYGLQAGLLCSSITKAWRRGRVDAVIQSTDKNFLVPVGGSVIAAGVKDTTLIQAVNSTYPGRASFTPILDLLITLLSLGSTGWKKKLQEREELHRYLSAELSRLAAKRGEQVLATPNNPISLALTLTTLESSPSSQIENEFKVHSAKPEHEMHSEHPARVGAASSSSTDIRGQPHDRFRPWMSEPDAARARPSDKPLQDLPPQLSQANSQVLSSDANYESHEGKKTEDIAPGDRRGLLDAVVDSAVGETMERASSEMEESLDTTGSSSQEGLPPEGNFKSSRTQADNYQGKNLRRKKQPPVESLQLLGAMLFTRRVSGCRVIQQGQRSTVGDLTFEGFGASFDSYPCSYLTAAAAIGGSKQEVDTFIKTLDACIVEYRSKYISQGTI